MRDELPDTGAAAERRAGAKKSRRVDPVSDRGVGGGEGGSHGAKKSRRVDPVSDRGVGGGEGGSHGAKKSRRVDPVSLVAGLLFIAISLAALTDRFWADVDAVLLGGGTIVALGAAMIVATAVRNRHRNEQPEHP